jgi:hypothetical protein
MTSERRYFQYPLLEEEESSEKPTATHVHPIKVYSNGLFTVTPNPNDKKLSADIDKSYQEGHYIRYREYWVTEKAFSNAANWKR